MVAEASAIPATVVPIPATCAPPSYSAASANALWSAERADADRLASSQITRSTADESLATACGSVAPRRTRSAQLRAPGSAVDVTALEVARKQAMSDEYSIEERMVIVHDIQLGQTAINLRHEHRHTADARRAVGHGDPKGRVRADNEELGIWFGYASAAGDRADDQCGNNPAAFSAQARRHRPLTDRLLLPMCSRRNQRARAHPCRGRAARRLYSRRNRRARRTPPARQARA